ncbi:hypothetical protein HMPREF0262_01659 [Clostridium sp. ATCC 29733]|nr:hypothetical protein HMPREF0262_01659 [Clostridium sp. ATCC 29733]
MILSSIHHPLRRMQSKKAGRGKEGQGNCDPAHKNDRRRGPDGQMRGKGQKPPCPFSFCRR